MKLNLKILAKQAAIVLAMSMLFVGIAKAGLTEEFMQASTGMDELSNKLIPNKFPKLPPKKLKHGGHVAVYGNDPFNVYRIHCLNRVRVMRDSLEQLRIPPTDFVRLDRPDNGNVEITLLKKVWLDTNVKLRDSNLAVFLKFNKVMNAALIQIRQNSNGCKAAMNEGLNAMEVALLRTDMNQENDVKSQDK